jgi:S-adenosylmethionine synthetase
MTGHPDDYVAASIREALARDPRGGELGIDVSVSEGTIVLAGEVATPQRKSTLEEIVREHAPDLRIHNEVTVVGHHAATSVEEVP